MFRHRSNVKIFRPDGASCISRDDHLFTVSLSLSLQRLKCHSYHAVLSRECLNTTFLVYFVEEKRDFF